MAMSLMCSFDPLCNGDKCSVQTDSWRRLLSVTFTASTAIFLPYTKNIGQFVQKTRKPSLEVANLTQRSRQAIGKSCKCYVQFFVHLWYCVFWWFKMSTSLRNITYIHSHEELFFILWSWSYSMTLSFKYDLVRVEVNQDANAKYAIQRSLQRLSSRHTRVPDRLLYLDY